MEAAFPLDNEFPEACAVPPLPPVAVVLFPSLVLAPFDMLSCGVTEIDGEIVFPFCAADVSACELVDVEFDAVDVVVGLPTDWVD